MYKGYLKDAWRIWNENKLKWRKKKRLQIKDEFSFSNEQMES